MIAEFHPKYNRLGLDFVHVMYSCMSNQFLNLIKCFSAGKYVSRRLFSGYKT